MTDTAGSTRLGQCASEVCLLMTPNYAFTYCHSKHWLMIQSDGMLCV
ncbi:hypothetical protein BFV94_4074 [Alteromonas macleodii]|uniref:Uncharacterized protein n=1 Tax=Alteromonas macleodii TaxID=28108 RepID=A0AB36FSH7_ALTMA|nr:hypothetical protein BFV95_4083 [Alteromonas macleodii]OES26587.1 hypothetical protein BFV94_4074 [Alteromonas macleodii]OES27275.1 hypothetical protein BFV93_4070 [Alteromonas macleodii]OES39544.1 hypothetical protein BFV96_4064 [Alteromonas macleodii]